MSKQSIYPVSLSVSTAALSVRRNQYDEIREVAVRGIKSARAIKEINASHHQKRTDIQLKYQDNSWAAFTIDHVSGALVIKHNPHEDLNLNLNLDITVGDKATWVN